MATTKIPDRIRWAVDTLHPRPDDHLLEIGCGPGVAVAAVCERLAAGGRIVAIDRSATAIGRAARRNADHVASGKAVLRAAALEELRPDDVLDSGRGLFDKVFAMNVNLFWVRDPAEELALIKRLLSPTGALYLFYGYGGDAPASATTSGKTPGNAGENATRAPAAIPGNLGGRLTAAGFTVVVTSGAATVGVVATPG